MQSVSSRIWTRVAVSISYDANHYTPGTSTFMCSTYVLKFKKKNNTGLIGPCAKKANSYETNINVFAK